MTTKSKVTLTDKSNPWLIGYRDPVAKLNVLSSSIDLVPLAGDGENKLVVGDFLTQRVTGFKGINMEWGINLDQQLVAVTYFYPDSVKNTVAPCLAFAVDGFVYIYQNNQPKFKFSLPKLSMHEKELEIWKIFQEGSKDVIVRMVEAWNALRQDSSITLSSKTLDILNLTKAQKQHDLIKATLAGGLDALSSSDTPTCINKINQQVESPSSPSQIVIGTEFKKLYILNDQGYHIFRQFDLIGVPVSIICLGVLQGDHRIIIATRDSQIQIIRNGQHESNAIDLVSKPVAMISVNSSIIVATMNESISSYNFKGSKQFTFKLNSDVLALEPMVHGSSKGTQGYLAALGNAELRIYQERQVIHTLKLDGNVLGMRFGVYGREDGVLIMILKNKGLDIRILQRNFSFQVNTHECGQNFMSQHSKINEEEDIPLNIPKKTKLFIEQSQRERDNPVPIYKSLEKDLVRLRLKTAVSYLNTLEESSNADNNAISNSASNLRIQADITGLGPLFKISMKIENLSNECLKNLAISYMYDQQLYRLTKPVYSIPFLLPHVSFPVTTEIESIDENGASDQIKVILTEKGRSLPLIGAIIQIPLAELRL